MPVTLCIDKNLELVVLCRTLRLGLKHMGMIPLIMCTCTLCFLAEMLVATCYQYANCAIDTVSRGKMCTLRRTYLMTTQLRIRRLVEVAQSYFVPKSVSFHHCINGSSLCLYCVECAIFSCMGSLIYHCSCGYYHFGCHPVVLGSSHLQLSLVLIMGALAYGMRTWYNRHGTSLM